MQQPVPLDHKPDDAGKPRVYTISPGVPFLRTFADRLIRGELIEGFSPKDDPLSLGTCTLYLPTRRAARALSLELLERMEALAGIKAAILPRIRTLGDLDEDEQLDDVAGFAGDASSILDELGKVIDPVERHLTLARLTRGWINSMKPETRGLFEEELIVLPSSASDALRLASDLADFMDQVETEEVDWARIESVADRDQAKWWEVTLRFLDIVMAAWPEILAAENRINPAELRRMIADHRIARLKSAPPKGPVIAAGSTGSIPATARLLKCIAGMERGAVILPGLDRALPGEIARRFLQDGELSRETASSTHPQYSMVRLLGGMKLEPTDVEEIGLEKPTDALRSGAINICLRPAEDTGDWMAVRSNFPDTALREAFSGVHLVEAPGERVEALAIALILRETLESEEKTAALVTPDRQLARRVAGELERFGIEIDDSAGSPLIISPAASQLRHMLRIVFGEADAVSWAGFFKSDLARQLAGGDRGGDENPVLDERLALLFELAIIRDCLQLPPPGSIGEAVKSARIRVEQTSHAPRLLKKLEESGWQALEDIGQRLSGHLAPLLELMRADQPLTIATLAVALLSVLGRNGAAIFNDEGGEELYALLQSHCRIPDTGFNFPAAETVAVFDALLAPAIVRSAKRTHPRLQIFGTLEARLQNIDRIVLGGLNESVWPPASRNDPFLNRPMRSDLGLPLPERRIGLAAHDFAQLSGKGEVFYTRAKRQGDAPAIASRWLQRIETFLGKALPDEMRQRGNRYLQLAEMIDKRSEKLPDLVRTRATPPLEARPKSLSITEIETWIRDPYAIYAKHVLGLRPLPDLVRSADPALRGTLYHNIFADFIKEWQGAITPVAHDALGTIADRHFDLAGLPPEINAIWRPRFDAIAKEFLNWEAERRTGIAVSFCEIDAISEIGDTGFILRGRADRIDYTHQGELLVLDYKTGGHPSKAQARTLSPQLALEGALAKRGKFTGVEAGDLAALHYIRLRESDNFKVDDITIDGRNQVASPGELADKAYGQLAELVSRYQVPDQEYVSRYAPVSEREIMGDYDHLARVREWSIAEEGDGENGDEGE